MARFWYRIELSSYFVFPSSPDEAFRAGVDSVPPAADPQRRRGRGPFSGGHHGPAERRASCWGDAAQTAPQRHPGAQGK